MYVRPRVDDREGPRFRVAGTNVKVFRCWIVAYMVRVVANGEAVDWFECVPTEDFAGAVGSIGHKQFFEINRIKDALGFALPRNARCSGVGFEIDDLYGVLFVAQRGDKETFAGHVHSQMVQPILTQWL